MKLLAGQKIDWIRRANTQRHTSGPLPNNGGQKFKKQGQTYQKSAKSMPCIYFNDNSFTFTKHHETKGVFYRHICSYCFAQDGKVSTHSDNDCDCEFSDLEGDLGIQELNSENTVNDTNYDDLDKLLLKKKVDQYLVQQARSCF